MFRNTSVAALVETLERFGAVKDASATWVWLVGGDDREHVQIQIIHDPLDFEIDLIEQTYEHWWRPLKEALGAEPTVVAGITWKADRTTPGSHQMFVEHLLGAHPGVASKQSDTP